MSAAEKAAGAEAAVAKEIGGGIARRELLGGAAVLGAAGALGLGRQLARGGKPGIAIFESSRPESRALARGTGAARRIDLAIDAEASWRALRAIGRSVPVVGFTSWGSYVAARGWLEERGLRLVSETVDRKRGLIAWHMR